MSQHARPRIERAFGWLKTIAGLRKVKLRGLANGGRAVRLRERRVQHQTDRHVARDSRMRDDTETMYAVGRSVQRGRTCRSLGSTIIPAARRDRPHIIRFSATS